MIRALCYLSAMLVALVGALMAIGALYLMFASAMLRQCSCSSQGSRRWWVRRDCSTTHTIRSHRCLTEITRERSPS